jgi:hypothetical protein
MCSGRPHQVLGCRAQWPGGLGFRYQRFSLPVRNEGVSVPKPAKQNLGQVATIVLSGTRGPWLFLVIREGLGSGGRLGARSTQRLTNRLRLALEPECLENPTATAREDPRDEADSLRDTQAVCGFRCWASKLTPLFHTIRTIVAIFLARVSRAISGRMPLANNSA